MKINLMKFTNRQLANKVVKMTNKYSTSKKLAIVSALSGALAIGGAGVVGNAGDLTNIVKEDECSKLYGNSQSRDYQDCLADYETFYKIRDTGEHLCYFGGAGAFALGMLAYVNHENEKKNRGKQK